SVTDVEIAVAEYVDWYNHRRLHGEIGLVPPAEYATSPRASQPLQHHRKNPGRTEVGSNYTSLHETRGDSLLECGRWRQVSMASATISDWALTTSCCRGSRSDGRVLVDRYSRPYT